MASQFRTHCFAVEICADQARFLRYDHGGATVTSTFSVYQEPYLVEFFARYNQASPETRGHDPSVVRLKTGTSDDDRIKDTKEKLGLEDNDPVFKFTVKDEFDQKTHVFHGAKIIVKASSCPQGRSTRGFLVLDEKGNKRFLKDTWRVDLAELDTEGKVYRILHGIEDGPGTDTTVSDRKVPHIPTVIASGDVEGAHQKTTMKDLWGVKEGKQRQYQHYYLVLKEVGKALDQFEDQLEWISATADAIEAHQKACEIHQILHRDISVGNILIYEGRGLLIDWEFSKCMTIKHARQTERTGTWQFMSARLLRAKPGENVTHTIADDLESFFHVTCWIALKHTQHGLEDFEVISLLRGIFDAAEFMPGMTYGGDGKRCALRALRMKKEAKFHPGPTKDLILDLEKVFHVAYQHRPSDEDLERVKATLAAGKMIDGDNDTLTDAHRWRIRQAQLEHRWVFNRFTTVVEEFRALSSPAPKRVSRPRLAVLATIPFIPSGASKRSLNMLSRIESSQSSKRQKTN
ncbi:hypothetical protein L218DRAFT_933262 [Marasmius fiardii PR-910]|nr:hypothetical protein L218DRAFT_933262 [Marasmius fiardii PR-910]